MPTPDSDSRYCTFVVAGLHFGLDVLKVQEVLRWQEMTTVPRAPKVVSGLLNLRGQIVTAIDLRTRLGLGDTDRPERPMNVVARASDATVSLLVDSVGDVVAPPPNAWESTPVNLRGPLQELSDGVYKSDGQILIILDLERVLDIDLSPSS